MAKIDEQEIIIRVIDNTSMLTKREYFAAMALQGILSDSESGHIYSNCREFANVAVDMADALIEVLNKK